MSLPPEIPGTDRAAQELHRAFRGEFPRLRTHVDYFFVSTSIQDQWQAELHTCSRRFETGSTASGHFYCRETLDGRTVDFISVGARPVTADRDMLVKSAISLIRAALDNPLLQEPTPPVV